MIKFLIYVGLAIPVFLFIRSVFFRRTTVLKTAASDFNRQVGYLALGIIILTGLILAYTYLRPMFHPV